MDLQLRQEHLEAKLEQTEEKYHRLQSEHKRILQKNETNVNTIQELTAELERLQSFKQAIVETFSAEELSSNYSPIKSPASRSLHAPPPRSFVDGFEKSYQAPRSEPTTPTRHAAATSARGRYEPGWPRSPRTVSFAHNLENDDVLQHKSRRAYRDSAFKTPDRHGTHAKHRSSATRPTYDNYHIPPKYSPTRDFSSDDMYTSGTKLENPGSKEFFEKARKRLSYDQYQSLLNNVKELNAFKQTAEETIEVAKDIFGGENGDLLSCFSRLLK